MDRIRNYNIIIERRKYNEDNKWDEQAAEDIGHAFGYYDYGQETGMGVFYSSKEAVANYIAGYVRMAFEGQMLYATSERGEGYIAYTLPGQKMNFKAGMAILKALFRNMSLKEMIRMGKALSKGGRSLQDRMKKEKKNLYSSAWSASANSTRDRDT